MADVFADGPSAAQYSNEPLPAQSSGSSEVESNSKMSTAAAVVAPVPAPAPAPVPAPVPAPTPAPVVAPARAPEATVPSSEMLAAATPKSEGAAAAAAAPAQVAATPNLGGAADAAVAPAQVAATPNSQGGGAPRSSSPLWRHSPASRDSKMPLMPAGGSSTEATPAFEPSAAATSQIHAPDDADVASFINSLGDDADADYSDFLEPLSPAALRSTDASPPSPPGGPSSHGLPNASRPSPPDGVTWQGSSEVSRPSAPAQYSHFSSLNSLPPRTFSPLSMANHAYRYSAPALNFPKSQSLTSGAGSNSLNFPESQSLASGADSDALNFPKSQSLTSGAGSNSLNFPESQILTGGADSDALNFPKSQSLTIGADSDALSLPESQSLASRAGPNARSLPKSQSLTGGAGSNALSLPKSQSLASGAGSNALSLPKSQVLTGGRDSNTLSRLRAHLTSDVGVKVLNRLKSQHLTTDVETNTRILAKSVPDLHDIFMAASGASIPSLPDASRPSPPDASRLFPPHLLSATNRERVSRILSLPDSKSLASGAGSNAVTNGAVSNTVPSFNTQTSLRYESASSRSSSLLAGIAPTASSGGRVDEFALPASQRASHELLEGGIPSQNSSMTEKIPSQGSLPTEVSPSQNSLPYSSFPGADPPGSRSTAPVSESSGQLPVESPREAPEPAYELNPKPVPEYDAQGSDTETDEDKTEADPPLHDMAQPPLDQPPAPPVAAAGTVPRDPNSYASAAVEGGECPIFDEMAVDSVKPLLRRGRTPVLKMTEHSMPIIHTGGGNFSAVFRSTFKGAPVLFKVAKAEFSDHEPFEELRRFSSLYPHPNVLPFLAMCTRFHHADFRGQLADEAIMVPYYEFGSLRAFIEKYPAVTRNERDVLNLALGMIRGVLALHRQRMVHRDIKCENFLVTPHGRVQICDLGLSRHVPQFGAEVQEVPDKPRLYYHAAGGMLPWLTAAPESMSELKFSEKSDMWMYGIALLELLTGRTPFIGSLSPVQLSLQLMQDPTFVERHIPADFCPERIRRVVLRCCRMDPKERPNGEDVVRILSGAPDEAPPQPQKASPPLPSPSPSPPAAKRRLKKKNANRVEQRIREDRDRHNQVWDANRDRGDRGSYELFDDDDGAGSETDLSSTYGGETPPENANAQKKPLGIYDLLRRGSTNGAHSPMDSPAAGVSRKGAANAGGGDSRKGAASAGGGDSRKGAAGAGGGDVNFGKMVSSKFRLERALRQKTAPAAALRRDSADLSDVYDSDDEMGGAFDGAFDDSSAQIDQQLSSYRKAARIKKSGANGSRERPSLNPVASGQGDVGVDKATKVKVKPAPKSNSNRRSLTTKMKGVVSSRLRRSKTSGGGGGGSMGPNTKAAVAASKGSRRGSYSYASDEGSVEAAESLYPSMPSKQNGAYMPYPIRNDVETQNYAPLRAVPAEALPTDKSLSRSRLLYDIKGHSGYSQLRRVRMRRRESLPGNVRLARAPPGRS